MTRELDDRRDDFEKAYLKYYVWAKDSFMTKWGNDCGRLDNAISYAVWFVKSERRAKQLRDWVSSRDEMSHICIGKSDGFDERISKLNNSTKGYHVSVYPTYSHRSFKGGTDD